MCELDAGPKPELRQAQMSGRGIALGPDAEPARPGPGQGHELRQGGHRQVSFHRQHLGEDHDLADRREGGQVVEGQPAHEQRIDQVGAGVQQQGVAVRCGAGHLPAAKRTAGAGAVFHHHGLPQTFAHAGEDGARGAVSRATGGEGHHHANGTRGEGLRQGGGGGGQQAGHERASLHTPFYAKASSRSKSCSARQAMKRPGRSGIGTAVSPISA